MLLIIILGLMAKLMSVSADCDIGTQLVNDFDWNKFADHRNWYPKFHKSNDFENKLECVVITYEIPEGNRSLFTINMYNIRKQRHMITYGNATNWNSTGYFDISLPVSLWSGRFYVIAVDYERYVILKKCSSNSKEESVYVQFRHSHPDKATVEEVLKVMQDNNIGMSQLVESRDEHCQQG